MIDPEGWVSIDDGTRLFYSTIGSGPQIVVVPAGFLFRGRVRALDAG